MRTGHLFAGAGGGILADLILGHTPVFAVEWDAYCCQVLRERVKEGWFPGMQVFEGDVRLFNASDWKGRVDCIHAGFPCQPHSVAGKRMGAADDRNLWPATAGVIGEIRPQWVFLENVPGLVSNGFIGTVLCDLASIGYDARWTCLGADQAGAPHRRERWWLLAHAAGGENDGRRRGDVDETAKEREGFDAASFSGREDVADAAERGRGQGNPNPGGTRKGTGTAGEWRGFADGGRRTAQPGLGLLDHGLAPQSLRRGWWEEEPDIGRIAKGVPDRAAKLKALGNGQVPLQAAVALEILSAGLL